MTNHYNEDRMSNRVWEAARFGAYIPNDPELEARSGGTTLAGIREIARNTLRATWQVLSLVLSHDVPEGY